MREPKVGDSVHYWPNKDDANAKSNGNQGPVAAVVTRVWTGGCVNLTIFPDHGSVEAKGSVNQIEGEPGSVRPSYSYTN